MRIGIDARELCGRATGVGRYLGGLLREWAATRPRAPHEFVLYAPEPIALALDARRFPTRMVPGSPGTWWEQVRLPRAATADHLDVWFRARLHRAAPADDPDRRRDPRSVVRRASGVVPAPRRPATTMADGASGPSGVRGGDHLGVLETRADRAPRRAGGAHSRDPAGHHVIDHQPSAISHQPCQGSVRRLHLQPPPRRRSDSRLRADRARASRTPRSTSSATTAAYPREDLRRTIAGEGLQAQVRWHEYVTDEQLRDLYAARAPSRFSRSTKGWA